jgi:zinc protease
LALVDKAKADGLLNLMLCLQYGDPMLPGGETFTNIVMARLLAMNASSPQSEVANRYQDLDADVFMTTESDGLKILIKCPPMALDGVAATLATQLAKPLPGEVALESVKKKCLSVRTSNLQNEHYRMDLEASRHMGLYPFGHPQYPYSLDEFSSGVMAVTERDLATFWKARFAAMQGQLACIGATTMDALVNATTDLFATASKAASATSISPVSIVRATRKQVPGRGDRVATYLACFQCEAHYLERNHAALLVACNILGSDTMKSRLAASLRQGLGLSYEVYSKLRIAPTDPSTLFCIRGICDPEALSAFEHGVAEVLKEVVANGFTELEVAHSKAHCREVFQQQAFDEDHLLMDLVQQLRHGFTMERHIKFLGMIEGLTTAEVNATFKKNIAPGRAMVFVEGPRAGHGVC